MKKRIFLSLLTATFLLSGCSGKLANLIGSSDEDEEEKMVVTPKSTSQDKYVSKGSENEMRQVKDVIYYKKGKNEFEPEFTPISNENIVMEVDGDNYDILPLELRKNKIDNLDVNNKSLGSTLKLIMTQLDKVGLIVEPNIDLNKQINMTIKDRNIYEAIKDIVEYSGYTIKYNEEKRSLVITNYVNKRYYIPASVFIDRSADMTFNSKAIAAKFDANLGQNISELFLENIKSIGSSEKLVTLDKQSGLVFVKERSLYINEIDDYITEFVHSRTQQFNVELAIVQIDGNKKNQFGLDLQNIVLDSRVKISSLAGGFPLASATASTDGKISYTPITGSSVAQGTITGGIAFDWLLGALDEKGYTNVVTKPNVLVQNHSIGYLSLLSTEAYISKYDVVQLGATENTIKTPVLSEYQEGLDFYVKLDKFPKKDFLQVAVVPNMKEVTIKEQDSGDGIVTMPRIEETSTFSVANIKSGDIIVLSGFKKKSTTKTFNGPLIGKIPFIGEAFNSESAQDTYKEIIFLVKVTEVSKAKDTFATPSGKVKELYRRF